MISLTSSLSLNAPINGLPQDGGVGQPRGNLTFSGFQMSISLPLGLHYKSNSHPWVGSISAAFSSLVYIPRGWGAGFFPKQRPLIEHNPW